MAPKHYTPEQLAHLDEMNAPDYQYNPGWETDHIAWVPYAEVVKDMQENSEEYHPGMLKLFHNSKDAIERALKIEPEPEKQGAVKVAWKEIAIEENDPKAEDPLKGNLLGGILESDADLKAWAEHEIDLPPKRERQRLNFVKKFHGKRMAVVDDMRVFDRGKGWGTKIITNFIEQAKAANCDGIIFQAGTVEKQQKGFDLVDWYGRLGFKTLGHSGELPLMVKWLKPQGKSAANKNCPSGKKKFFDEVSAIGPQKHWDKGTPNLRAYKCPLCGWWHLTSKPQWTDEQRKRHSSVTAAVQPTIDAHREGDTVWLETFEIPEEQRGKGLGQEAYEEWENSLPKDVQLIRLFAANTGGEESSASFWKKMGFEFVTTEDDGPVDAYMWKGINGHSTPKTAAPEQMHMFPSSQDAKFRQWFNGSKVVDKAGNPMPVYHGTRSSVDFDTFAVDGPPQAEDSHEGETTSSGSGADPTAFMGAHFAEETNVANQFAQGQGWTKSRYEGENEAPRVIQVYLRITNPKDFGSEHNLRSFIYEGKITDDEVLGIGCRSETEYNPWEGDDDETGEVTKKIEEYYQKYDNDQAFRAGQNEFLLEHYRPMDMEEEYLRNAAYELAMNARMRLEQAGHDGVRYKNVVEGGHAWIAFAANQIKSAYSQFDPSDQRFTASAKTAATHTPEYAQQLIEALKRTVKDADFRVVGSVGAGGTSDNDLDIVVDVHPNAEFVDDMAWVDSSGLTAAMKLLGFDYDGPSDFSAEESAEKSEISGKYLDPQGSGIEKYFNPTTMHTVEFWFEESGIDKEADWKSKYVLPTALALTGLGAPPVAPTTHEQVPISAPAVREKQVSMDELVDAIRRTEGANPDLHNPGNLVGFHSGQIMEFETDAQGEHALKNALKRIADGKNPNFAQDVTLEDAGKIYANGDPNWAKNVSKILSVDPKTSFVQLIKGKAKVAWAKRAAGFAFKSFKKLWHVGSMDVNDKREGSLEGIGLSVSVNPEEWAQIAEIGGDFWELTKPGNKFLNFHRLSKPQRQQIMTWGIQNGYAEEISNTWRFVYFDSEADEERYMEFTTQQEAQEQLDEQGEGGEVVPVHSRGIVGTARLGQRTKNSRGASDIGMAFDLVVTVYAEDELDCDGVWWADTFVPASLSAPRGVIFPSKLSSWKVLNTSKPAAMAVKQNS